MALSTLTLALPARAYLEIAPKTKNYQFGQHFPLFFKVSKVLYVSSGVQGAQARWRSGANPGLARAYLEVARERKRRSYQNMTGG